MSKTKVIANFIKTAKTLGAVHTRSFISNVRVDVHIDPQKNAIFAPKNRKKTIYENLS